eukprot:4308990-Pleurochrysis_carterae.AAC.2
MSRMGGMTAGFAGAKREGRGDRKRRRREQTDRKGPVSWRGQQEIQKTGPNARGPWVERAARNRGNGAKCTGPMGGEGSKKSRKRGKVHGAHGWRGRV